MKTIEYSACVMSDTPSQSRIRDVLQAARQQDYTPSALLFVWMDQIRITLDTVCDTSPRILNGFICIVSWLVEKMQVKDTWVRSLYLRLLYYTSSDVFVCVA